MLLLFFAFGSYPPARTKPKSPAKKPAAKTMAALTSNEVLMMWLMPFSQVFSWLALVGCATSGRPSSEWLLAVGIFYWLWAVKNRTFGPLKNDLGVFTYLAVIVPGGIGVSVGESLGTSIGAGVACAVMAAQFGFVAKMISDIPSATRYEKMATKYAKTEQWAKIFFYYCVVSSTFWVCGIVHIALL
jgi:hypothetical protein